MNFDEVSKLKPDDLADYVWRRLRFDPPVDPPTSDRFGPEPPERFLIQAAGRADGDQFRTTLVGALEKSLVRLLREAAASETSIWSDSVTNEQLASIAFLSSAIDARELVERLYNVVVSWVIAPNAQRRGFTSGQFHLLRALASLQEGPWLAKTWKGLWQEAPRSMRGLIIFGWARADADEALNGLGELVDMEGQIDLPSTLWSLIGPKGPGVSRVAEFARKLTEPMQHRVREALATAGADESQLARFAIAPRVAEPKPAKAREKYDVFLCHNSQNKSAVTEIGKWLEEHGIRAWLAERELRGGECWQDALQDAIENSKCAFVFIGTRGLGPWQEWELRTMTEKFLDPQRPLIPVILPGVTETPLLPVSLKRRTWVDFREGGLDREKIGRLIEAIPGGGRDL